MGARICAPEKGEALLAIGGGPDAPGSPCAAFCEEGMGLSAGGSSPSGHAGKGPGGYASVPTVALDKIAEKRDAAMSPPMAVKEKRLSTRDLLMGLPPNPMEHQQNPQAYARPPMMNLPRMPATSANPEENLSPLQRVCQSSHVVFIAACAMTMLCVLGPLVIGRRNRKPQPGGGGVTLTTPRPFDCSVGALGPQVMNGWTEDRKRWCCQKVGVCPDITTTSLPFDCDADIYAWRTKWSPGKQAWCCDHYDKGCVKTTTPVPFNCEADINTWQKDWSISKKAWCCEHEYVGCPTMPPTSAPAAQPVTVASTTASLYDCSEGVETFLVSWPQEQQTWCCNNVGVACSSLGRRL